MKKLLLLLLVACGSLSAQNFETLQELLEYVKNMEEYPDADNTDWSDPDYTKFHEANLPSFWSKFGIGKKSAWHIKAFVADVTKAAQERENKSLMGNFALAIMPKENAQFFIWGDVQGALHSLARDLKELRAQNVIDDSFKILNPDHYFVFNGDAIDRSPYILETINVLVRLMLVNPDQIIYNKGNHETKEHWHNYGLRRELEIRAAGMSAERIPLNGLMNRLFNTLSQALYIVPREVGSNISVVRISHYGTEMTELNEKEYGGVFEDMPLGKMILIKLDMKKKPSKPVTLKAIIKAESRTTTYRPTKGLAKLEEDKGATAWTQLSSPTGAYRRLYEFFHDAFTVLAVDGPIDNWVISLYNQDVREMYGFKKSEVYKITTGAPVKDDDKKAVAKPAEEKKPAAASSSDDVAALKKQLDELSKKLQATESKPAPTKVEEKKPEPAPVKTEEKKVEAPAAQVVEKKAEEKPSQDVVPGKELVMGVSLDLTKGAKVLGERLKAGMNLAFDQVNAQGGLNGQKIHLVLLDDEYTPEIARKNVDRIMGEFKTNIMFSPSGSPTVQAYFDLVKDGKLLVLFPNTGAPIFRKPEVSYIIHFRPSYVDEGKALVNYALKEMQATKFALFYQDDAYGQGALQGGREALKAAGIEKDRYVEIPYKRNDVDFKEQAKIIKEEKPDAILFYSTSIAARGLINAVGVNVMVGKKLLGLSDLSEDVFRRFVEEKGLKFVTANVVPNPKTSDLEIVKEFRALASKNDTPQDIFTLEAYIIATLFIHEMKQVKGPITADAIIDQFEKIKSFNFKGLDLNFVPADRALSHVLWLDTGADEWVKQDLEVPQLPEGFVAPQRSQAQQPQQSTAAVDAQPAKAAEAEVKAPTGPIVLGTTMDVSKGARDLNIPYRDGMNMCFNALNEAGGVEGREVRITVLDDGYLPDVARKNVETLMKDFGMDVIFGPSGSAPLQAYIDLVKDGKIAVLFPLTGAAIFRKADLKNIIHVRPSYVEEGRVLAKYVSEKMQAKKIMLFYQDDASGKTVLEGAIAGLKEIGFTNFIEVPYERNTMRFAAQAETFKKEKPDAICFFSSAIATKELIKQIGVAQLSSTKLLGMSDLADDLFNSFMKESGLRMVVINAFPNPDTSTMPIVKEYRDLATKNNLQIDVFGFEGYFYARLFAHLVKQTKGVTTKEALLKAAESIKDLDFEGFPLNFNPQTRELSYNFWINTGESDWVMQKVAYAPDSTHAEKKAEEPAPLKAAQVSQKKSAAPAEQAPVAQSAGDEKETVQLGSTMDLSKGVKNVGIAVREGFNAFFDEQNAAGGVNGRKIKTTVLDDNYLPDMARKNVHTLMNQYGIDIIFAPTGSDPLQAYLDVVKEGKIVTLFPLTGALMFRKPEFKYMVHVRPSYFEEGHTLAKYAIEKMRATKIMILYQNDSFGLDVLEGARLALKALGFSNFIEVPYERNTVRFQSQIKKFKAEQPDTICFFATSIAAKEFIKQAGVDEFSAIKMLGVSDLADDMFSSFIKEIGLHPVISNVFPDPATSNLPIVVKYRELAAQKNLKVDIFGFEGYLCARLFAYMMKQIKGPITKESLIQAAENIRNVDFDGFILNFNKQTRELSNSLWLNTGDAEWVHQIVAMTPEEASIEKTSLSPVVMQKEKAPSDEKVLAESKAVQAAQTQEADKAKEIQPLKSSDQKTVSVDAQGNIRLGTTIDLSRGLRNQCIPLRDGFNLFFNSLDASGRQITVKVLDDEYSPDLARKNVESLIKDFNADIIFMPAGSATVQSFLDLAEQGKILILFPETGALVFRKPDLKYVINFRPSYYDEGRILSTYAVKQLQAKKMMLFYQNDSAGNAAIEGVKDAYKEIGFTNFFAVPYERNTVNFQVQAQKFNDEKPDAICFFSTSIAAKEFIKKIGVAQLSAVKIMGMSDLADDVFNSFIQDTGLKAVVANALPNPQASNLPIVKEYRDMVARHEGRIDIFGLEAFICAKLFDYMVRQIKGPVTKESIIAVAEGIKDFDFGGIVFNFNPQTRELSNSLWLNTGDPEWILQKVLPLQSAQAESKKDVGDTASKDNQQKPSAEQADQQKDSSTIKLGTTLDLSKGLKNQCIAFKNGFNYFFNFFDASSDNQKKINVTVLDDEYSPELARKNVETLMSQFGIDIIFGPAGSATVKSFLDLVEQKKILVLFPLTGAPIFRKPDLKYMIHIRPSYFEEGRTLAKYAVNKAQAVKIMMFYQDDAFGQGLLEGARAGLKELGFTNFIELPYQRNTLRFATHVAKFEAEKPDAICFFCTSIAAKEFMKQIGIGKLAPVKILGMSDLADDVFNMFIQDIGLKPIVANAYPNPETSELPLAKEYRELVKQQSGKIDIFGFEGFVAAKLFAYIAQQVKGAITKEALIEVAENIKDLDFGGIKLTFSPQTRELSHSLWLNTGNPEWEQQVITTLATSESAPSSAPAAAKNEGAAEKHVSGSDAKKTDIPASKSNGTNGEIKLGSTLDLSKGIKNACIAIKNGFNLFFNSLNSNGGVHGKQVRVTVLDDEYSPEMARTNVETLMKDFGINIIFLPTGSANVKALVDLVEQKKILVLFPEAGAPSLRQPDLKYMIHLRPSYFQEGRSLAKYAVEQRQASKIMFFYQDDTFGQGTLDGAKAGLQELGYTRFIAVPYQRNTTRFSTQVAKFEAEKPDTICFFSTSIAAKEFMKQIGIGKLASVNILGMSDLADDVFNLFIKETGLKAVVANAFPNPDTSSLPIVQEYRDMVKNKGGTVDIFGLEGFMCAKLFTYMAQQIQGAITKEALISVAENIKDLDFGGITLNFNPKTRELSNSLWLNTGDPEWSRQEIKASA